jgi:hypothetical protein
MTKTDPSATQAQGGYSGKIPVAAIIGLESELAGLTHGTASLVIHIRDGRLVRYATGRERSHMAGDCNDSEPSGE